MLVDHRLLDVLERQVGGGGVGGLNQRTADDAWHKREPYIRTIIQCGPEKIVYTLRKGLLVYARAITSVNHMLVRTFQFLITLGVAAQLPAQVPGSAWPSYGHDPQHSGVSTVQSQPLTRIKWHTPVDVLLAGSAGTLFVHYGSPLVTANNNVIVPVRTGTNPDTFRLEVRRSSDGVVQYTLETDYILPPHNWVPPYGAVISTRNRLYYAGAGGTVYYRDQPDSTNGASGQIVFYGKESFYIANRAAFNNSVMISTPLVADQSGNIYFGFRVAGREPGEPGERHRQDRRKGRRFLDQRQGCVRQRPFHYRRAPELRAGL